MKRINHLTPPRGVVTPGASCGRWLVWLLLGVLLGLMHPAQAAEPAISTDADNSNPFARRNVLVLNSASEGYGGYEVVVQGIQDGVLSAGGSADDLYVGKRHLLVPASLRMRHFRVSTNRFTNVWMGYQQTSPNAAGLRGNKKTRKARGCWAVLYDL